MAGRKRIMLVFGTRPEAIKMAPVYRALRAEAHTFETLCCVTGQHRDMLDQVLRAFEIAPDIDLDLMQPGQGLADLNAAVLTAIRGVLRERRPDLILVHGDTTTSMASALAAFYEGIPVGHVEAGLRSGDMRAPFPEELNRRVTGMVASYHFAPTERSKANLIAEGRDPASVAVTGNTVVDALKAIVAGLDDDPIRRIHAETALDAALGLVWRRNRYVLVTCHRRETISAGLEEICGALGDLARANTDTHFVYPVHRNPALGEQVRAGLPELPNLHLIAPLGYESFLQLMRHCHCMLTDSGGMQEEGPVLGKPVLVMREVTERPEAVEAGGVRLVGVDRARIVADVSELLADDQLYRRMAEAPSPFGDGTASKRIADFLRQRLSEVSGDGHRHRGEASLPSVPAAR